MGLLRLLFGKRVKNIFKVAVEEAKDDKELQQSYTDLAYHTDKLELHIAEFCSENPLHKSCQDYKTGDYEKVLKRMCKKYPDDKELLKKLQEMGWSDEFQ